MHRAVIRADHPHRGVRGVENFELKESTADKMQIANDGQHTGILQRQRWGWVSDYRCV